jgi:RNA recognition motif-containing protein
MEILKPHMATFQTMLLKAGEGVEVSSSSTSSSSGSSKIFIGNVPFDATEDSIADLVSQQAGIQVEASQVTIARGGKKLRPRGFLFIQLASELQAEIAVSAMDGYNVDGERVFNSNIVDSAAPKVAKILTGKATKVDPSLSVHISGLDYSLTDQEVRQMCLDMVGQGLVAAIKVPVDRTSGMPKGYAHAQFVSEAARDKAIRELDGLDVLGRVLSAKKLEPPKRKKEVVEAERAAEEAAAKEQEEALEKGRDADYEAWSAAEPEPTTRSDFVRFKSKSKAHVSTGK